MSAKTETATPETETVVAAAEQNGAQEWFSEDELPKSERVQSESDKMRELLRSAPIDPKTNKPMYRKLASATTGSANLYSTYNGKDFHVKTVKVGSTKVKLTRGDRKGQTIDRDTFDVYARYEPGFMPRPKSSNGNGSK